jgi:hypothetical protein
MQHAQYSVTSVYLSERRRVVPTAATATVRCLCPDAAIAAAAAVVAVCAAFALMIIYSAAAHHCVLYWLLPAPASSATLAHMFNCLNL